MELGNTESHDAPTLSYRKKGAATYPTKLHYEDTKLRRYKLPGYFLSLFEERNPQVHQFV